MMTKVASNIIRRYQMNMLYKLAGGVGPAVGAAVRNARPNPAPAQRPAQPGEMTQPQLNKTVRPAYTPKNQIQVMQEQAKAKQQYDDDLKNGKVQKPLTQQEYNILYNSAWR